VGSVGICWDQLGRAGISWDNAKPVQVKSGQIRPGQVRLGQVRSQCGHACGSLRTLAIILKICWGTLTLACGPIGAHSEYARGTPVDVLQRFGIPGDHDTEKILGKSTWSPPGAGHSLEFVELGVGAPPPCWLFWKAQYMSSCSVSLQPVRRRQTSEMSEIQRTCTGGCSRAPNLRIFWNSPKYGEIIFL
jgi:hypothetical protein